jgi:hypothetical protein
VARRRGLLVGIVAVVVGLWALAVSGVIANWTMVWCLIVVLVTGSTIPYVIDYRRGNATVAFGMPEGRTASGPASPTLSPAPVGLPDSQNEVAVSSLGPES